MTIYANSSDDKRFHVHIHKWVKDFRWGVIVGFVDIGGIIDYHCIKFL
jgi:hypothetical protein